jgi:hypothetical protein
MKVWATSHQRMSTSGERKPSSEKGNRSRNRQSKTAACNIKNKLHNQTKREPEPPCLKQKSCPKLFDDGHSGTRHTFLIAKGLEYIEHVDSWNELLSNLLYDRDTYCVDPNTVPDAEVEGIAKWWWEKRLQNQIYDKNYSVFNFPRQAFHQLRALPSGHVALDLYLYLHDKHGHILGKTFQINVYALQRNAGFAFGHKALRKVINQLFELGYLTICKNYKVGQRGRIFQLSRPKYDL